MSRNAKIGALRLAGSELYGYKGPGHAAYEETKDFNERVFSFLEA